VRLLPLMPVDNVTAEIDWGYLNPWVRRLSPRARRTPMNPSTLDMRVASVRWATTSRTVQPAQSEPTSQSAGASRGRQRRTTNPGPCLRPMSAKGGLHPLTWG
jgi:hypothetical protein